MGSFNGQIQTVVGVDSDFVARREPSPLKAVIVMPVLSFGFVLLKDGEDWVGGNEREPAAI